MIQRRDAAKSLTARVADTLIEEVEAADVIVIAAPMYIYLVCPPFFGSTVPVATGYFSCQFACCSALKRLFGTTAAEHWKGQKTADFCGFPSRFRWWVRQGLNL